MSLILVDIGNTICKICLMNESTSSIYKTFNLKTSDIRSPNDLKKIFKLKKIRPKSSFNSRAFFSSVVPSTFMFFKTFLKKEFGIKVFDIKDKRLNKVVTLNIKNPLQVGSDRIANAAAVYKIYKLNCIIIDFGTATTFDVVTKKGIYNGGVIAPGIELSMKNLHLATAQLPYLKLKKAKKLIGKNTLDAMLSGFYWGYLGLIKNIIIGIKKDKLICTGGLANLFAKSISSSCVIDQSLTIKGIFEIYKLNKKNLS